MSLGLNGMATELGVDCDCSIGSTWFLSPTDFLRFRAEWVPYLDRFSAAVHASELPDYVSQTNHRQKLLEGTTCPEQADLEPRVPKVLPRWALDE